MKQIKTLTVCNLISSVFKGMIKWANSHDMMPPIEYTILNKKIRGRKSYDDWIFKLYMKNSR